MSTATFIDFKALKERVRIDEAARWLGLALKDDKANSFRAACPVCGGGPRSMKITPDHVRNDGSVGSYYCHTAQQGGDVIGLVAHIRGITEQREAARVLQEHFGGGERRTEIPAKPSKPAQVERTRTFDPEAYAERLDPAHELLGALAVSEATFRTFKAGYAGSGIHRGKLALPLHDRAGKLIGHFARSLKGESPLLSFVNGQNPAEHIFGAHLVAEGDLYIARDPLDVLVAHENGEHNVVAFLTDGISPQQWEMLASLMDQRKCERSHLF